jgi:ABC-type polysaccharide/polyol phosphate export permease
VHFLLGLSILAVFLLYYQRPLHLVELAWFPVAVLVQFILTLGCALLLSAIAVHFRDVRDILGHLMTFWFFATPIIYPYFVMEDWQQRLLNFNPMSHLAITYQEILYFEGPVGHWKWLLAVGFASLAFFFFGYFVFDRLRDTFAEEV